MATFANDKGEDENNKNEHSTTNKSAANSPTAPRPATLRSITLELVRKRSEHNDGLVSDLEEISLHQENLEAVGPVLGRVCGKTLRILLLQNNVISRMTPSDLRPLKRLEYLNLALNNVETIEGVAPHAEFLEKLDLTLNFVPLANLEASVAHLRSLRSLRELFLMGNPCVTEWADGCRPYVVANLPSLERFDGTDVTVSERLRATQRLGALRRELRELIAERDGDDDATSHHHHDPRLRSEQSRKEAKERAEREEQERANQPRKRGEKEFETDQKDAVTRAREREASGTIMQCNEPKLDFSFDETTRRGCLLLDVALPKHLSSSLVDVDVHPTYVSVVVKSKVLRLRLPSEVRADASTARRSTTTGRLLVTMPKVNEKEGPTIATKTKISSSNASERRRADERVARTTTKTKSVRLNDLLYNEGSAFVTSTKGDNVGDEDRGGLLKEVTTTSKREDANKTTTKTTSSTANGDDENEPPPLF